MYNQNYICRKKCYMFMLLFSAVGLMGYSYTNKYTKTLC